MTRISRLAPFFLVATVLAASCLSLTACGSEQKATPPESRTSSASAGTQTPDPRRAWSFHGQRGITAAFTPTDLALYRLLLPPQFDMPQSPLVAVAVVNYYDVAAPLVPYHEGYVFLQCQYQGQTGWYVLTMPVDDQTADAGGRALGFPKYIADKIDLAETGGGWSGDVAYQGQSVMHVSFTPGSTPPTAASSADPGLPIFLLVPPAEGPQVNEVDQNLAGERQTVTTSGTATIEADANDPWAGLLPAAGTAVWGQLQEMTGDWVLTAKQR
jgi:hypothetical protein